MSTFNPEGIALKQRLAFNPERIVLARRLEGVTQKELSTRSGLSQAKLSKLQNGIISFNESDAVKLSGALDYPISYFEESGTVIPLSELTYRKTSRSSMGELNSVSTEYSLLMDVIQKLCHVLKMKKNPAAWIDEIAPHEQSLSEEKIERLAIRTRECLGLKPDGAVPNVTRAIERAGIIVSPMRSLNMRGGANLTSEGVTAPSSQWHAMCIGYLGNGALGGDRLRFTKAHELGHLILHRYRKPDSPQLVEREAHIFAGAFLISQLDARLVLKSNLSLRDFLPIKAGWGISIAALISRSHNLGIIDRQRYTSLNIQLSGKGWKKQEPVPVGIENPLLLKQMITSAYGFKTDQGLKIDSIGLASELGAPFRYLDYWSDGLDDEGMHWGIAANRFEQRPNRMIA